MKKKFKIGEIVKTLPNFDSNKKEIIGHIGKITQINKPYVIISIPNTWINNNGYENNNEYIIAWKIECIRYLNDIETAQYLIEQLI